MKRRLALVAVLMLLHVLLGLLVEPLHSDRLGALVLATIYVPLLPLDALGLPVFVRHGMFFPGVSPLGWLLAALAWVLVYYGAVTVAARAAGRLGRSDGAVKDGADG